MPYYVKSDRAPKSPQRVEVKFLPPKRWSVQVRVVTPKLIQREIK